MLKNVTDRSLVIKQIAIRTADTSLADFLAALLDKWTYNILPADDADILLLAEEGCCEPLAGQSVIWLTPSGGREGEQLALPLVIEDLWKTLEQRFHRPPRQHIRKNVNIPVRLESGGNEHEVVLTSLSDMGCRFSLDRELVRDETVRLDIPVEQVPVQVDGAVIYSIAEGGESFRTGLVFHGISKELRDRLRDELIVRYLEEVRKSLPEGRFRKALDFVSLPAGVVRHFGPRSS